MSSVQKLFEIAVSGSTRAERRNAFNQLRELSVRGDEPEASEAREALQNSARYAQQLKSSMEIITVKLAEKSGDN